MRKPFTGSIILVVFLFLFLLIYKPLSVRESQSFSFAATVAIYSVMMYLPAALTGTFLNMTHYFSEKSDWTFLKDILSAIIIVSILGIVVYLLGFLMEDYHKRLNLATFADSVSRIFLIGIIPFILPLLFNYRYLLISDTVMDFTTGPENTANGTSGPVKIISRLKKEDLSFSPGQLIYAESEGNYVSFHLSVDNKQITRTIRSSIYEVEEQLSSADYIFRTHRAFLVNTKRITSAKGNSLGYRLKLEGTDNEIPVSRNRVTEFNTVVNKLV